MILGAEELHGVLFPGLFHQCPMLPSSGAELIASTITFPIAAAEPDGLNCANIQKKRPSARAQSDRGRVALLHLETSSPVRSTKADDICAGKAVRLAGHWSRHFFLMTEGFDVVAYWDPSRTRHSSWLLA
jgi:hypothetical protein